MRALYQRLVRDGVDAWLDKEKLLPGQDWRSEIPKAVQDSDVVVVCLSNNSITKEGYVQKEIKFALDKATEKPEGTIFLIPARLEECNVPAQLGLWQWVDLFESDGYEWLMRSLRLRAEKTGVPFGDTVYTGKELEEKLEQLYTEGLAALWMEDWDKAIHHFQAILRDQPYHSGAAQKLEEAKHQMHLRTLYNQAIESQKVEDWDTAVKVLEKLVKEAVDYKDVSILLSAAQKRKQLVSLYNEARRLHKARQWAAVVKVFAQITSIESNFQDPDNLLVLAEKEAAELNRLNELNVLYGRAVHELDAGHLHEARGLLKQVQQADSTFKEAKQLLTKVEVQIQIAEEQKKLQEQINTLYEQARGLVRSKLWSQALEKIKAIQILAPQFDDPDGIEEKVKFELEREKEKTELQNKLAAIYSKAVRLMREQKYQGALENWQEIVALDPEYPDRHNVQATSKRELEKLAKASQRKSPLKLEFSRKGFTRFLLIASGSFTVIVLAIIYWQFSSTLNPPHQTPQPTQSIQSRIEDTMGVPMVLVPSGTFKMGSDNSQGDESPLHEVYLDAYYIDQYEVTNARYGACVQANVCSPPGKYTSKARPDGYYNASSYNKFPVIYVDWNMAKTYCEWRGTRLPTEAEWEKAARGIEDTRIYSWGNESPECSLTNYINCPQGDTQEVIMYPRGKSPYGLYNVVGNVWEWVADWYAADYYLNSPAENPTGHLQVFLVLCVAVHFMRYLLNCRSQIDSLDLPQSQIMILVSVALSQSQQNFLRCLDHYHSFLCLQSFFAVSTAAHSKANSDLPYGFCVLIPVSKMTTL